FVAALASPRIIMMLVPAGPIIDAVVFELQPLLSENDLIIDCGNSNFADTQKRTDLLLQQGMHFMGLGVSGGETGARFGPSIMPGGDKKAYGLIAPMLQAIAAKVNGEPCVAYMGNGAAGHYVKMVHNGIEYAIMQLISESYHLLKKYAGLSDADLHSVYFKWNKGKLQSFLIEITAAIFGQHDDDGKQILLNNISDVAHQKGTGAWMSKDAMDTQQAIPTIDAAVSQRALSSMKEQRIRAEKMAMASTGAFTGNVSDYINQLEDALYFAVINAYAQGLAMLGHASTIYKYNINIATVAAVWRGGCIIRAGVLEDIRAAYAEYPELENLLLNEKFATLLQSLKNPTRATIISGIQNNIPLPAFSATLSYFDSYRSGWLPANLIQAQRDFFGAHTYERLDKPGIFHTNWNQTIQ
ncbi:MAG: NADP-dependent phosphogluconate dehydrogenase, partial [Ferruginibacter sp.]